MQSTHCESCLMPLDKDPGRRPSVERGSTEHSSANAPESKRYCSLCFKDGKLCYEGNDLKEFQRVAYQSMIGRGMNKLKAKFFTFMIRFAPRWKTSKIN